MLGRTQCTAVWHCRTVLATGGICLCTDSSTCACCLQLTHDMCPVEATAGWFGVCYWRPLQVIVEPTAGPSPHVEGPTLADGIAQLVRHTPQPLAVMGGACRWHQAVAHHSRADATAMATVAALSAGVPLSCCCAANSCAADTTALLLQVAGLGRTGKGASLSSHSARRHTGPGTGKQGMLMPGRAVLQHPCAVVVLLRLYLLTHLCCASPCRSHRDACRWQYLRSLISTCCCMRSRAVTPHHCMFNQQIFMPVSLNSCAPCAVQLHVTRLLGHMSYISRHAMAHLCVGLRLAAVQTRWHAAW